MVSSSVWRRPRTSLLAGAAILSSGPRAEGLSFAVASEEGGSWNETCIGRDHLDPGRLDAPHLERDGGREGRLWIRSTAMEPVLGGSPGRGGLARTAPEARAPPSEDPRGTGRSERLDHAPRGPA